MLKKTKKLFKSKDPKILIENFISLSALQVLNLIFPMITLPYLAKVIGLEKFGVLAVANAIIVFFHTFTEYGFNYTSVRDISKNKSDLTIVSKIFHSVFISKLLLMILSFIILLILIEFIPKFQEFRIILLLTFLSVPGYVLFPDWFFQAMEKMKYITILNVISKFIFTLLIFLLVQTEADYYFVPILSSAGFIVSGIISLIFVYSKFEIKLFFPKFKDIIHTIKTSTNMFISLILPNLYTNLSVVFLQDFWGKSATGIFDASNKFISISQQITNVLSRTFYPFLARRMDKHRVFEIISFSISIVSTIVLFFGAEIIIKLFFTQEFYSSIVVLKILSFSPVFLFMMNAYGTNYLVLVNKEALLRNIIIFCSVFGLILSYVLIKKYSFIGAAYTILSVWAIRGLITWFFALKHKKNSKLYE
jgi:O-antigen/teichoic acid export membrane protein